MDVPVFATGSYGNRPKTARLNTEPRRHSSRTDRRLFRRPASYASHGKTPTRHCDPAVVWWCSQAVNRL